VTVSGRLAEEHDKADSKSTLFPSVKTANIGIVCL